MDKIYVLKGKDVTSSVEAVRQLSNGKYEVVFKGRKEPFFYSQENVEIEQKRQTLDGAKCAVIIDGVSQRGVSSIDDFGRFYVVRYKSGYAKTLPAERVQLRRSCLDSPISQKRFEYFKATADSLKPPEYSPNVLANYYEKLDFVREDTVLANYIEGRAGSNLEASSRQLIFPFGFNLSQKVAVENAMQNQMSVIQGPPGTGKTQTILNVVANLVIQNKTVAAVSNNNSAIGNIYEKMEENDLDFVTAQLGSVGNKDAFISNQYTPSDEQLLEWKLDSQEELEVLDDIYKLSTIIEDALERKNYLSAIKFEYDALKIEAQRFVEATEDGINKTHTPSHWSYVDSSKVLDLWREIEKRKSSQKEWTWLGKIILLLRCRLKIDRFFTQEYADMITATQKKYYKVRLDELSTDIKKVEQHLKDSHLDDNIMQHRDLSMLIYKSRIARKYIKRRGRKNYLNSIEIKRCSEEFVKDYPVVLSTTYSLCNSLAREYIYDYLIIDEASQVDLVTFVLALSCAKNVVVVGDQKQLPNVIKSNTKLEDDKVFGRFNIPDVYKYSTHSALSSMTELFGDKIPTQILREHYRCHPKIIEFCNRMFYDGQLIVLTPESTETRDPLKIYATVAGNHARENHVNQRQIDVTFQEVVPREELNLYDGSVGIVTPYRNHASELNNNLSGADVLAATVDKFQGRERDVIILNTVDNKITDFASDPNRLNVAVSRAKEQLIVVTNGNYNSMNSGIDELLEYIRYNNFEEVKSGVRSIYDYLYRRYYERRQLRRVTEYDSENVTYELIQDILSRGEYSNLECVAQYPLKLLCGAARFEGRKRDYVANDNTKIDFVIFKKTSKTPVLAIEVDGYEYHASSGMGVAAQRGRDTMKDEVLRELGVLLVRLPTTGSGEDIILIGALGLALGTTNLR